MEKSEGCFIVYDITNPDSFYKTKDWFSKIKTIAEDTTIILVGNKNDLKSKRQVTNEEGRYLAKAFNAEFFEISAKNPKQVDEIFRSMVYTILGRFKSKAKSKKGSLDSQKYYGCYHT